MEMSLLRGVVRELQHHPHQVVWRDAAFTLPQRNAAELKLTHEDRSAAGRLPDALDPGFHCVRTHWILGFMAFRLARCTRTMLLMVPV